MPLPVVTTGAGGLPVVEVTARALPVIEAANGRGLRVTKVSNGFGLPVIYSGAVVITGPLVSPANMTSNTAPAPFVASALSEFSGGLAAFQPFAALGAGEANSWVSGTGTLPQWIQIDLGSAVTVAKYAMTTRNAASPHEWTAWTLSGSANGSTWTVADTRTSSLVGTNIRRVFDLAPQRTFRYWRWDITATSSNQYADCGQLALYGP